MAELGVIASIIGIAGVGIKLSKTLYVTGDRALSADHNLRRLATNVSLFSASLKHFAHVMKANETLYSPEYEQTAYQIVAECEHVFEELTTMAFMANQRSEGGGFATNDGKKRFSLVQRVKVYFEQPKVDWLMAQLEYLKTTLSVLIQTLNLAAITAKAKEESETLAQISSERIEQERMHVETLILARQLSVVILHQQNYKASDHSAVDQEEVGRVSPVPSEEISGNSTFPKLLTQGAASPSMGLVQLGHGTLEFLDNALPEQAQTVPPTMFTSHNQIIDQLLGRWTLLPEMEQVINERNRKGIDLEGQILEEPIESDKASLQGSSGKYGETPDLNLHLVDSVGSSRDGPPLSASPQSSYLNPPPTNSRPPGRSPPPLTTHTSYPLPPPSPSAPPANAALHRSVSSPGPPTPNTPKALPASPQSSATATSSGYSSQERQVSPHLPSTAGFEQGPPSPATSPRTSLSHVNQFEQPKQQSFGYQGAPRNPYAARVSPADSPYGSSVDSEGDEDDRDHQLGLGIPWRIRIGAKYWDFLDDRLVGPRTPYLPTEPMSWLYSHDFAHTEIAEKWVCEEAIAERSYPYTHIQGDDGSLNNSTGVSQMWRILCPLKFKEIDGLVERTIDIYRRRTAANTGPPPSSRGSDGTVKSTPVPIPVGYDPSYLASLPPQMPQHSPQQLAQDAASRQRPPALAPWQQGQNIQPLRSPQQAQRSVSFQESSPQLPLRPSNLRVDPGDRSPRGFGEASSVGANPEARSVHWAPSSAASTVGTNPGPGYGPPPPLRSQRDPYNPRDRRERYEGESDEYDRQRRRARPSDREKKRKKKSSTAATFAKVGGLMAMLDGLDAI